MLKVSNLSVKFGDKQVLNNLSFELPEGELLSVIGPSGSGKTTLLRCIMGLQKPDSGTISWSTSSLRGGEADEAIHREQDGLPRHSVPRNDAKAAMMFQQPLLYEHLSVGENVAFGIYRLPKSAQAAQVRELLELVELPGFENRNPRELSGGEQQRVSLARTLAVSPDYILFDEPFSALDDETRFALIDRVVEILHSKHIGAIFVTHRKSEIKSFGERVLEL